MPLSVFYDADCALCRASARRIARMDRRGECLFVDANDPRSTGLAPGLPREPLRALLVCDDQGNLFVGFDAVRRLMSLSPWSRLLSLPLYLSGIAWLGRHVYGVLARHRRGLWASR